MDPHTSSSRCSDADLGLSSSACSCWLHSCQLYSTSSCLIHMQRWFWYFQGTYRHLGTLISSVWQQETSVVHLWRLPICIETLYSSIVIGATSLPLWRSESWSICFKGIAPEVLCNLLNGAYHLCCTESRRLWTTGNSWIQVGKLFSYFYGGQLAGDLNYMLLTWPLSSTIITGLA